MFRLGLLTLCALALSACAASGDARLYARQVEQGIALAVPHVRQPSRTDCGVAALASVMEYHGGSAHSPRALRDRYPHASARGYSLGELREIALHHDFVAFVVPGDKAFVRRQLDRGRPLIVPLQVRSSGGPLPVRLSDRLLNRAPTEDFDHYVIVVGVDDARRRIIAMDPARGPLEIGFEDFAAAREPMDNAVLLVGLGDQAPRAEPRQPGSAPTHGAGHRPGRAGSGMP